MEKTFSQEQATKRYEEALADYVDKVKQDPNVIAVILSGSLAYDKVWDKSDMDTMLIVRDQNLTTKSYCINEDNIPINVDLITRSDFRAMMGKARGGHFTHSMFSRSRVVYTTDDSITEYLADIQNLGDDDRELTFFAYVSDLIGDMEKIEKWLVVKKDPLYAQLYILQAARNLADMRLLLEGQIPNRESIPRVMELDPGFMAPFYVRPLSGPMTEAEVYAALASMRQFLEDHLALIKAPAVRYMEDGEVKTVTMLVNQFGMNSHSIYHVFDFLADMGVVDKVSETIRITPKGRKLVEETAFLYTAGLLESLV